jgi:hypothetical protein
MSQVERDQLPRTLEEVRRIVFEDWNPIGVGGKADAEGEYGHYVPAIARMVTSGKSTAEIFEFLWNLEVDHMGLTGNRGSTQRAAEKLHELSQMRG